MRELLKRIYYAIRPSNRVVVMDYPIDPKPLYTREDPHQELFKIISAGDAGYAALLNDALKLKERFYNIQESKNETDPLKPAWNNNYVPGLDIIMLYTMICHLKPSRYVEIGSGTTTKTVYKARREQSLSFNITCIDPHPRQEIREVADQWMAHPVQKQSLDIFRRLRPNDIVFFDGTHTLFPNSDVAWFFLEILPVLPSGVVVQVHDIYLPYDYPQFMLDRYYSENYLLGALILNNPGKFEILAPNYYISETEKLSSILTEIWRHPALQNVERHGGSFWFRIR